MLSDYFGIMSFDANTCPVHLAVALPKIRQADEHHQLPPSARPESGRIASGRGLTAHQAELSCLGEAAELASACVWGDEALVTAPYRQVANTALHPQSLLLLSDKQYDRRDFWNARHGGFDWIPERLDETVPIDWVEVASPDGVDRALVPATHALIGYFERGEEGAFAIADSNGCAAGETLEQATIAAFLELVERDAAALWWYGRHSRPKVDLSMLRGADDLLASLRARERRFHILDLTTDLGIPVCAAISAEPDGHMVAIGAAAHFDASQAAISALTEMAQIEFSLEMRQAVPSHGMDAFQFWLNNVTTLTMPHLLPIERRPGTLPISTRRGPATVEICLRICREAGLQLFVLDLTRPAIGVPVVRAIVPGMRHTRYRLAPGRLFDVPVKQGWCDTPPKVEHLNPIPLSI